MRGSAIVSGVKAWRSILLSSSAAETRIEQTTHAVERFRRPAEPAVGQYRRGDAGVGRPAGMQPLGPGSVGKTFGDAGGLAGGNADGVLQLLRRQAHDLARRDGG